MLRSVLDMVVTLIHSSDTDEFARRRAFHRQTPSPGRMTAMDWKLEVIVVPVSDVDRAKDFYADKLKFNVDVDHRDGDFRVVQVTPPGSACSITFGSGINPGEPGSLGGLQITVTDIRQAHRELVENGVDASEIQHFEHGQPMPGPDPEGAAFNSFVFFADPDGNRWAVQEGPH
jgi:catechol 2,3-dioxygenase-like lactoylglutathione lyase family enzyme